MEGCYGSVLGIGESSESPSSWRIRRAGSICQGIIKTLPSKNRCFPCLMLSQGYAQGLMPMQYFISTGRALMAFKLQCFRQANKLFDVLIGNHSNSNSPIIANAARALYRFEQPV